MGDHTPKVLPVRLVTQLCMEGTKRQDLGLQVLENRSVHPDAELLRALPVPCIVRETAARRLELARVTVAEPRGAGWVGNRPV